jgi:hypothetical protein
LPGRSLEDRDPVQGNFIARIVTRRGEADVSPWQGQPVRLRVVMRGAKLCAFQFINGGE